MPMQQRNFRKDLEKTLANLVSKYEPGSATPAAKKGGLIMLPSVAKPIKKPPAIDPDDFSDDESYYKHRAQMLRYKAWRYSLFCAKNIVQHELPVVE